MIKIPYCHLQRGLTFMIVGGPDSTLDKDDGPRPFRSSLIGLVHSTRVLRSVRLVNSIRLMRAPEFAKPFRIDVDRGKIYHYKVWPMPVLSCTSCCALRGQLTQSVDPSAEYENTLDE